MLPFTETGYKKDSFSNDVKCSPVPIVSFQFPLSFGKALVMFTAQNAPEVVSLIRPFSALTKITNM